VLHRFNLVDGAWPYNADLVFDQTGDLYGTTPFGGGFNSTINNGLVYELIPSRDGWTETILHNFGGFADGGAPHSGVIFDQAGNLYGTTSVGGAYGAGTVFQLSPSGSGWTKKILHSFQRYDGITPVGGLILDQSGNLYGTTPDAGAGNGGTVYMLTPSNGDWTFTVLYAFTGASESGPTASLAMDEAGNLYGTTPQGGPSGVGEVFKLTHSAGGWEYTALHDFTGIGGWYPTAVTLDADGNIYGTCSDANTGWGLVFEITP